MSDIIIVKYETDECKDDPINTTDVNRLCGPCKRRHRTSSGWAALLHDNYVHSRLPGVPGERRVRTLDVCILCCMVTRTTLSGILRPLPGRSVPNHNWCPLRAHKPRALES